MLHVFVCVCVCVRERETKGVGRVIVFKSVLFPAAGEFVRFHVKCLDLSERVVHGNSLQTDGRHSVH